MPSNGSIVLSPQHSSDCLYDPACILPFSPPRESELWPGMRTTLQGLPREWPTASINACADMQGAFMAALYAQGLAWERMHEVVREYAGAMGSVRHLLSDLTLPIISVFSGAGFDRVIRQSFQHGAQRIEDLWLRWVPGCPPAQTSRLSSAPGVHLESHIHWRQDRLHTAVLFSCMTADTEHCEPAVLRYGLLGKPCLPDRGRSVSTWD